MARSKDAGCSVACICGNAVAVPRLSELRALTGTDPYITNPVETIRKLQSEGADPAGTNCLLCGSSTPELYKCHAECESSHVKRTGGDDTYGFGRILLFLFLPVLLALAIISRRRESETFDRLGHDVEVSFNLPVCDPCAKTIGNVTRPAIAKTLMLQVPVYKELLEYYPRMKLLITRD
jgi:hypothetical protein